MNVAVIFGGISTERNVSLNGGKAVIDALRSKGHNVYPIDPAMGHNCLINDEQFIDFDTIPKYEDLTDKNPRKLLDCINSDIFDKVDVAFIVLHGKYGEDGTIQALLEMRGVPYTGSDIKSSALAIDKISSKIIMLAAGIPTPPWLVVHKSDFENFEFFEYVRKELGNELVIKPNDQGSTIGISIVDNGNLDDIQAGIKFASQYSKTVVVEKYIEGREITVSVIGGEAYPVIEIVPLDGYYDYEHKYTKGMTEYVCPAEISDDITEFTQNLALSANNVIGCRGFSRVDFRLDDDGQPFCLEVNTIPGFTSTSLVPKAAASTGLEFPELCEKIIDIALEEFNGKVNTNDKSMEEDL